MEAVDLSSLLKTPILFDLDGTVTDPRPGFIASVRHALEALDEPTPPEKDLLRFIGPPLRGTFALLLRTRDRRRIEKAVELYRERLYAGGMFEAEVYPGMRELLHDLAAGGCRLFIATGKPEECARQIIDHFHLSPFFEEVRGAMPDGRFCDKAELIADLYRRNALAPASGIMIGDTAFDMRAGRLNRLATIGVTWGYGTRKEMEEEEAGRFVEDARQLRIEIEAAVAP